MWLRRDALVLLAAVLLLASAQPQLQKQRWMDASLPVDERVSLLVAAMTNDEKDAQLKYGTTTATGINASRAIATIVAQQGIGGVGCDLPAAQCPALLKEINAGLKTKMRVWIPPMQICESTHSGGVSGSTLFPMPVALGQSWNLTLMEAVGRQQGLQARAGGCSQALSPVLQVVTDPRFGRLAENFGEDPVLVTAFGLAAMKGIQGKQNVGPDKNASVYFQDPVHHPFCQAKHYCAYGASSKDGYTAAVEQSERALFEVFLMPWRELVSHGLRGVMASHNIALGVPMHANKALLSDVLRDRFGLGDGGYIGSDADNVYQLSEVASGVGGGGYGIATGAADATQLWMNAGGDQAMPNACGGYDPPGGAPMAGSNNSACNAARLVEHSMLEQSVLDRAVSNVLRQKFALRLFEDVVAPDPSVLDSAAARALSREAAVQGIVLLQNRGILPLQKPRPANRSKIAVLGLLGGCSEDAERQIPPFVWCAAKQAQLDDYSTGWGGFGSTIKGYASLRVVTVEAALRRRGVEVTWRAGASPDCQPAQPPAECAGSSYCPACNIADSSAIAAAVAAGEAADTVVLVIGDTATGHHLSGTAGEGNDRHSLGPSGAQAALLAAITSSPSLIRKTVVVHIGGRPMTFGASNSEDASAIPAILTAMRPGEEGGEAIAKVLFGEVSPSGRLTNTWVRDASYIGTAVQPYWQYRQIQTRDWMDGPATALFPFGHGLSYTNFSFSNARIATSGTTMQDAAVAATKEQVVNLSVYVRNTGHVASAVVVQAYCGFQDTARVRIMRYARMLCGFTKVFLAPGESTNARLALSLRTLARWDSNRASVNLKGMHVRGAYVIDHGLWQVVVGDCSGAGAAIGLPDAVPCEQQRVNFTVLDTVYF